MPSEALELLARQIVSEVLETMDPFIGDLLVEVNAYTFALDTAKKAVAELLDPEESFDVEIVEDDPADGEKAPQC